jgi:hypothetical protein
MTNINVLRRRLVNQLLSGDSTKAPHEVVKILGAIQAQDYAGGEWSIGLRIPGSTISDIRKAISERQIVRTWAMRGTLHFLAGTDIDWMLRLLAPGLIAGLTRRYDELGLDERTFRKAGTLFTKFLKGGGQLTRKELVVMLEKNGISCEGQRAPFILHRASIDRVLCFGAKQEKQETHALFDEWVPVKQSMERNDALAELARRYFTSHGPATIQDYMWWSGLRAEDARLGLGMAEFWLRKISIEGNTYWMPKESVMIKPAKQVVHLLPPFDSFLIGYKDRAASIDKKVLKMLRTGGMPDSTIMIDGNVVGKWKRRITKKVTITTELFREVNRPDERALRAAVERYAEFTGNQLEWESRTKR